MKDFYRTVEAPFLMLQISDANTVSNRFETISLYLYSRILSFAEMADHFTELLNYCIIISLLRTPGPYHYNIPMKQ